MCRDHGRKGPCPLCHQQHYPSSARNRYHRQLPHIGLQMFLLARRQQSRPSEQQRAMSFSCVKSPWIFFESFRAAHFEPLLYLTTKKEVRVIAPTFRAYDYVYTAFHPKVSLFCLIRTTIRGF